MRILTIGILLLAAGVGRAKEATIVATDSFSDIRVLGQLNVNTATREQLLYVVDATTADRLLRLRQAAPIADLGALALPADSSARLKTDGASTLYRIRQRPLQRIEDAGPATTTTAAATPTKN